MTVIPFPSPSSEDKEQTTNIAQRETDSFVAFKDSDTNSVVALKELVASLTREQNKVQDLLSSLGFALRSFSNLDRFLELIPLMAARVTDAAGGVLILYTNDGKVSLEQIHCQNRKLGTEISLAFENVNFIHQKNNTKPSQLVSNPLDEKITQELKDKVQIYGTPILIKNEEQGRLYIFSDDPDYVWTATRNKLVQLVADQTAVAIDNHYLTVQLKSKERQDRELEIASEIQVRLLPNKCPEIKGLEIAARCNTASRVGGDYYDFIQTNYDRLGKKENDLSELEASTVPWSIVIGDVMGKGVPAGLIMTMTRGMLRAEVLNRHSPAKIMNHLNRVMYADLESSHRFVSMFYSEYNPKNRVLSFTNAAHNPPLWWSATSGTLSKLDTWGMLIGLDIDSEYEDGCVTLNPGDIIMYYTDGFTDAVNDKGERFEEDNLCKTFLWGCENLSSSEQILNHLFKEVEEFRGSTTMNKDDMTLIIMRVSE